MKCDAQYFEAGIRIVSEIKRHDVMHCCEAMSKVREKGTYQDPMKERFVVVAHTTDDRTPSSVLSCFL